MNFLGKDAPVNLGCGGEYMLRCARGAIERDHTTRLWLETRKRDPIPASLAPTPGPHALELMDVLPQRALGREAEGLRDRRDLVLERRHGANAGTSKFADDYSDP